MKAVVTGATGFIGVHVARALADEGCEVVALVRPESKKERLLSAAPSARMVEVDWASPTAGRELERIRPDVAIHLGWYLEHGKYLAARQNLDCLTGSLAFVEALIKAGCPRMVGIGTCFEYELSQGLLKEECITRPSTLYAAAKLSLCQVAAELAAQAGRSFAWARLFYLYGPHEGEGRLVASVIRALLKSETAKVSAGEQVRDFLHVEDAARGIVKLALSDVQGPVNVASGVPVLVRDVVKTIASALGASDRVLFGAVPYRPTDPMFVCADTAKIRARTAWKPAYDLERGIGQTAAWWRKELGL